MATPYSATSGGSKDAYNFYQSQLQIRIECAFGMLVHRWGILRKPIPCLVMCLCRLHIFTFDQEDTIIGSNTRPDDINIVVAGGVPLEGDRHSPQQLIGGGHHNNDMTRMQCRC
jgi:hypothetical protein